jgi:hypothetical protein
MPALTAFPADGFTARWQRWDADGDETLQLRWENEGWTAVGEVSRERVTYVMRLSPLWQLRQFLLFRDLDEPDLWLGTDGSGRWGEVNGNHRTDLDGCADIELACTPFTAAVTIRRHQLEIGDSIDVRTALVDTETLGITSRQRRFTRHTARRWSVGALPAPGNSGDRVADTVDSDTVDNHTVDSYMFDIDEFGLPQDIEERFRRR